MSKRVEWEGTEPGLARWEVNRFQWFFLQEMRLDLAHLMVWLTCGEVGGVTSGKGTMQVMTDDAIRAWDERSAVNYSFNNETISDLKAPPLFSDHKESIVIKNGLIWSTFEILVTVNPLKLKHFRTDFGIE